MSTATLEALDRLKPVYRVTTRAQVIVRALALAKVAADHHEVVDGHNVVTIQGQDGSFLVHLDG
jgi:acetolactate synthase small subunit